jgi:hypothetical protein
MRFLLALALSLAPTTAHAGTRATYVDGERKKIVIEVADNGDARITSEGSEPYGVLRGGEFYTVGGAKGAPVVARVADIAAALGQVMPPIFKEMLAAAEKDAPAAKLRIEPRGSRKSGGRDGLVFAVYGMDDSKRDEASEIVVSRDPALKPVGQAVEGLMVGSTLMLGGLIGPAAAEMAGDMRKVFALGTPLDMAGKLKLVALEEVEVPAAATELPARPRTVAEIVATMKTNMASQAAEPAPPAEGAPPTDAEPEL